MYTDILLPVIVILPMAAGIAAYLTGRRHETARDILTDVVCISEAVIMIVMLIRAIGGGGVISFEADAVCGMGIRLMLDGFRCVYGTVAGLMWAATSVFSRQYFRTYRNRSRFYLFFLLTFGATLGVFLSADLFTAFIFFEIMSFTSFVWVAHDETEKAMRAAYTYLTVAVIGGLVTLMGLFMLYNVAGTLKLNEIPAAISAIKAAWPDPYVTAYGGIVTPGYLYLIGALLAFGFAAKAGVWPLHIWLPKAHPVAPAPASALLSGILTKSGIFGILAITCNMFAGDGKWGYYILILGAVTMFTGAFLALFSTDLKRTLACSSLSQIGFIMTGIGVYAAAALIPGETAAVAARGTLLHMINHSMIKLVLFMAAGVIYMNIHRLDLNEIRGYGRKKPLLKFGFAAGAFSISGIPLSSGYVSKTLLHEAIVLCRHTDASALNMTKSPAVIGNTALLTAVEWIFLISGGMTLCYMLKLFIAIFVEKNNDDSLQEKYDMQTGYWNTESRLAITIPALLLLIMGFVPYIIMNGLGIVSSDFFGISVETMREAYVGYYSWESLSGSLISIAIGAVLYIFVIRGTYITEGRILSDALAELSPFIQSDNNGRSIYTDIWPHWLDLEEKIYRPLILKVLPGITGFVCAVASRIPDDIIIIMRKTIHRQISTRIDTGSLEDHLAVSIGRFLDRHSHDKGGGSHIPKLVAFEEKSARTQRVISSSLSFGLILVCIGLILVLIYTLRTA